MRALSALRGIQHFIQQIPEYLTYSAVRGRQSLRQAQVRALQRVRWTCSVRLIILRSLVQSQPGPPADLGNASNCRVSRGRLKRLIQHFLQHLRPRLLPADGSDGSMVARMRTRGARVERRTRTQSRRFRRVGDGTCELRVAGSRKGWGSPDEREVTDRRSRFERSPVQRARHDGRVWPRVP